MPWIDIGCPNFEAAQENRERIANNYAHAYWDWLHSALEGAKFGRKLPKDIPIGELPCIQRGKHWHEIPEEE